MNNNYTFFLVLSYLAIQVWDLGGQTSIRPYWRCYYPNTDAIIFVVDSCDVDRLGKSLMPNACDDGCGFCLLLRDVT